MADEKSENPAAAGRTAEQRPSFLRRMLRKTWVKIALAATALVIVFGTTQFIPQLLQEAFGYTAEDAGLALTYVGLAAFLVMPLSGFLTSRVDAGWRRLRPARLQLPRCISR
jgi:predicted MFS family arabinose efflux permease